MTIKAVLKAGLAAGLIAGLILGLYILFVMEPLIDEALAYEEEAEPVPREVAKGVAFGGGIVTGVLVGIPFALVFTTVNASLRWRSVRKKAWAFGLLAFIVFSLLPLLAVPGAPPGVERNLSVEEREFWYVATMLSAMGGVLAGYGLYRVFSPSVRSPTGRSALMGASLAVVAFLWALPFLLKPEITMIPGEVPLSLLQAFIAAMFIQWAIFWASLSTALGILWSRMELSAQPEASQALA